jgi:phage terminase large subunit
MPDIVIPHHYSPRSYQQDFFDAMWARKRAVLVWHRRAGKDKTTLNFTIMKMIERVGLYYYFLPTYAQGKKIVWDGIGGDGFAFMNHFPTELVAGKSETEMQVTLKNGSVFQVIGTDKIDSIVGTNPVGCVFSEYSLQNPKAWDLMRPILGENGGWAVFVYTPRGKNHGWRLYELAQQPVNRDRWYVSRLTVDDTFRDAEGEDGRPVFSAEQVQTERDEGMSEQLVQQEYYVDFEGAVEGAYYADQMALARREGRVTDVPWDSSYMVDTAWDLGVDDSTVILFTQTIGDSHRVIDYYENAGHGLEHYAKIIREKNYVYGQHFAPHDLKVRDWSTGQTRVEFAANLGLNFTVVPRLSVEDGIQAGRRLFPKTKFDEGKCQRLIDALSAYHREWDEKLQVWGAPVHDWASNPADAWRYRAIAYLHLAGGDRTARAHVRFNPFTYDQEQTQAETGFNPLRHTT